MKLIDVFKTDPVCNYVLFYFPSIVQRSKWPLLLLWLPISTVLLILHTLPVTSMWANYLRGRWKRACVCEGHPSSPVRMCVRIPGLICTGLGILLIYLVISIFSL